MTERLTKSSDYRMDFHSLSDFNFVRHRRVQWLSVALAAGAVLSLSAIAILVATASGSAQHIPESIVYAGIAALVGYLSVTIASWPVRMLGRPPVGLTVNAEGLTFELATGRLEVLSWAGQFTQVSLLLRPDATRLPSQSRYRLLVLRDCHDQDFPWRRVVPVTYLTHGTAERIVESAKMAGMVIKENQLSRPLSLFPSIPGTGSTITRT